MAINKKIQMLGILSLVMLPLTIFAFEEDFYEECEDDLDSRVELGGTYARVNMKPHGSSSFDGNLGGIRALYEYRPVDSIYAAVKFSWQEGTMHGSAGKRSLLYFDVQERIGLTYGEEEEWFSTIFTGFGYKHLGQKLDPTTGSSIKFNYNEIYIPVGFLTNFDFACWFSVGATFIWMPQVYPVVSIVPLKGAYWNLEKTLNNFYVDVPFTFTLTDDKEFQIILNPFYERWEDGHSTAKLSSGIPLGLPGNTYNFYGVDLTFAYLF